MGGEQEAAARGNFEQALSLYIQTEGESSFRTNQVRVKLGEIYSHLGMPQTAR